MAVKERGEGTQALDTGRQRRGKRKQGLLGDGEGDKLGRSKRYGSTDASRWTPNNRRVIPMEVPDERGIQSTTPGNPGELLRTIPLPVDEVLVTPGRGVVPPDGWSGGGAGRDNGLVETGLTWETWKVGCTRREGGSRRRTAQGLIVRYSGQHIRFSLGANCSYIELRMRTCGTTGMHWDRTDRFHGSKSNSIHYISLLIKEKASTCM